jgi:hypothetical protein
MDPDLDPVIFVIDLQDFNNPESGNRKNAGSGSKSGSALNQCGSATMSIPLENILKTKNYFVNSSASISCATGRN